MWVPIMVRACRNHPTHMPQDIKRILGDEFASINQELLGRVFFHKSV